jgi:hypothetical protein
MIELQLTGCVLCVDPVPHTLDFECLSRSRKGKATFDFYTKIHEFPHKEKCQLFAGATWNTGRS